MDPVSERYRKAEALRRGNPGPTGQPDVLAELFARIGRHLNPNPKVPTAPPVNVAATPPALPPFEGPGASLPMDRYMLPQASAEVVRNTTPAPQAAMPAAAQPAMAPEVPPMPAPVQIGASDGSVRGDILAAIEAKKRAAMVPPWAVNQGTLADQQG